LKAGGTWTWDEYIAALRDHDRAAIPPALGFWIRQDLPAILDVWERYVGCEHIHVVTVPPQGAPHRLLLERFCEAIGVDADLLTLPASRSNQSLGAAEAEALRLLNASFGKRASRPPYERVIKRVVVQRLAETTQTSCRLRLPAAHHSWVESKGREIKDTLARRGYHVVGDLEDLIPDAERPSPGRAPGDVTDREVLDASTRAASALTERLVRVKALRVAKTQADVGPRPGGLASRARVAGYRAKRRLAALSGRNRTAAKAATFYRRATLQRRGRR
jgi:hypothetical protein